MEQLKQKSKVISENRCTLKRHERSAEQVRRGRKESLSIPEEDMAMFCYRFAPL